MDLNQLEEAVVDWARDREILKHATPEKQLEKTLEEVGELVHAIRTKDLPETMDAIGDVTVTLIIIAKLHGWTLEECLRSAYEVIRLRTGRIVDGKFVKDVCPAPRTERLCCLMANEMVGRFTREGMNNTTRSDRWHLLEDAIASKNSVPLARVEIMDMCNPSADGFLWDVTWRILPQES